MLCDPLGCVWLCVCVCVVRCVCIRKYGGRLFSPPLNLVEWKFRTFDGNMLFRLGYSVWRFWYSLCVQYCMVKCVMCEIEHSLRITSTVWTEQDWDGDGEKGRAREREGESEMDEKKTHTKYSVYMWIMDGDGNGNVSMESRLLFQFSAQGITIYLPYIMYLGYIHNDLWIHT